MIPVPSQFWTDLSDKIQIVTFQNSFTAELQRLERLIALFLFQQAESAYSSAARVLPAAERAESLQETTTEIRCGTTSLFSEQAICSLL